MNKNEQFWKLLIQQLEAVSMSQAELCRQIEIPRRTFEDWKKNQSVPGGLVCHAIAEKIGVSVQYLLTGDEVAMDDDDYLNEEELSYTEKGYPTYKRSLPRSLPPDILEAIMYCSDDQMQGIRKVLGLLGNAFAGKTRDT